MQLHREGNSWKEIADQLGVSERTVWEIRARYNLDAYIVQLAREDVETHLRGLVHLSKKSKRVIESALDGDEMESSQLEAAKHVSSSILKMAQAAAKLAPVHSTPSSQRAEVVDDAVIDSALARRSQRR